MLYDIQKQSRPNKRSLAWIGLFIVPTTTTSSHGTAAAAAATTPRSPLAPATCFRPSPQETEYVDLPTVNWHGNTIPFLKIRGGGAGQGSGPTGGQRNGSQVPASSSDADTDDVDDNDTPIFGGNMAGGGGTFFNFADDKTPPHSRWRAMPGWIAQHTRRDVNWPRIRVMATPSTCFKFRKTWRGYATIGADYNTQMKTWQFHSSWQNLLLPASQLSLVGRQVVWTKHWAIPGPAVLAVAASNDDAATTTIAAAAGGIMRAPRRLVRWQTSIDLATGQAKIKLGLGMSTSSSSAVTRSGNIYDDDNIIIAYDGHDGVIPIAATVPVDGQHGHVQLQVRAHVAVPQPELAWTTGPWWPSSSSRSSNNNKPGQSAVVLGLGDIEIAVHELNLILSY